MEPIFLNALIAVVCCILGSMLAATCLYCACFAARDEHGEDSHDDEGALWKEAGTPTASVDYEYTISQRDIAEGLPPVPQVDGSALEKAMRLKALLEQVHAEPVQYVAGPGNSERQNQAQLELAGEGDEQDVLGEVDGDHLHQVADKAEQSWGKMRGGSASGVAWDMASVNRTQSVETTKAALVTSWMRHGSETPPSQAVTLSPPAARVVEVTFGAGPLGIKFGKQRIKTSGAGPEWQAVCVAQIFPGQQASQMVGLKPGMAILVVNGKGMKGLPTREVMHALTHSEPPRPLDVTFGWPGDQSRP
jgi:hypothetical protein